MVGVERLYKDKEEKGLAKLIKFEISKEEADLYNLRAIFNGESIMKVRQGTYVKLYVNGELMMSDTDMEKRTNIDFVNNAKGEVMIAGLGIGLIIHNLREKVKSKEVTSITVYEKYQDVIDLVSPYFKDFPITYKCEDILQYKPKKDEKYDTIYFDIWPSINYDNNLPEIRMLHNRWKSHKKSKDSWMNSWMKEFMQERRKKESRNHSCF